MVSVNTIVQQTEKYKSSPGGVAGAEEEGLIHCVTYCYTSIHIIAKFDQHRLRNIGVIPKIVQKREKIQVSARWRGPQGVQGSNSQCVELVYPNTHPVQVSWSSVEN